MAKRKPTAVVPQVNYDMWEKADVLAQIPKEDRAEAINAGRACQRRGFDSLVYKLPCGMKIRVYGTRRIEICDQ